jgi:hypothetical protein
MLKKVFSSALFGPVQYFAHLASESEALIEVFCNYARQTYRNRYVIAGANGSLALSVPVVKTHGNKVLTKDVLVSYDTPWNEVHWKSIEAAYSSSPYYQYYKDDIEPLFHKKWKYLLDLNMVATEIAIECTGLGVRIIQSQNYIEETNELIDLRETIHPKKSHEEDTLFKHETYRQVFMDKHCFLPNLSILDLIFNKGPEALIVLENCIWKQ